MLPASQFGGAICIMPASPPPPVTPGLQVDSCMAKDAIMMGGTGYQPKSTEANFPGLLLNSPPYCLNRSKYCAQGAKTP